MLQIHGEGDPSGRGEALSMIKTSMKGGFKAIGQSVEDRLKSDKQNQAGGHKYNVARQTQEYADAIRRVWVNQARALSSVDTHEDRDMEGAEAAFPSTRAGTPESNMPKGRPDDDSASMFSGGSGLERTGKVLKITREYKDKYGGWSTYVETPRDPRVIREYMKRRNELDMNKKSYVSSRCSLDDYCRRTPTNSSRLDQFVPTGDKDRDAAMFK